MRFRLILAAAMTGAAALGFTQVSPHLTSLSQHIAQFASQNLEITPPPVVITPHIHITEELPAPAAPLSLATRDDGIGPFEFPENINPLTGLLVEDADVLERRPMVVKISNAPPLVRPQAGIGSADIVFEHYAEGGLTRFSAVFYSQTPTRTGSIRSSRLVDHEIVPMFDGILAFSGASIGVEKYIYGSEDVNHRIPGAEVVAPAREIPPSEYAERAYKGVLYGLPYYWRDENIPVPHNMFTNPAALWELAERQGHAQRPDLRGLAFHPDAPEGSSGPAQAIDLRYRATRIRWVYDEESGLYRRFADGQGHYDSNTNQQVTSANIIIMYAEHTPTEIIESQWENSISWSTQIAVWGEGDAILFRDGQRYDGRWVRTVREEIIALRTNGGEILYLKPGNTWFQIVRTPEQQNPAEEWLEVE
jgi:hypothetical protein